MPRLRISPALPLLAIFLFLCYIGIAPDSNEDCSRTDGPLLAYHNGAHRHGPAYLRAPTGTSHHPGTPPLSTGTSRAAAPTETCFNPPLLSHVVTDADADELCQCSASTYSASQYYRLTWGYTGKARCEARLRPRYANQTKAVDGATDSFTRCIVACVGSFDKRKKRSAEEEEEEEDAVEERRQYTPYWFCHGVNFVPGELCEFVGEVAGHDFPAAGVRSWDNGLSDGTWNGY